MYMLTYVDCYIEKGDDLISMLDGIWASNTREYSIDYSRLIANVSIQSDTITLP